MNTLPALKEIREQIEWCRDQAHHDGNVLMLITNIEQALRELVMVLIQERQTPAYLVDPNDWQIVEGSNKP